MTLCRFPTGRNKASQSIISPVDRRSDRQENRRLPGADARWPIAPITISLSPLRVRGGCAEIAAQMAGGTDQRRDIRMPLHGPTRHGSIRPASFTVHGRFSCVHAARKSRFQSGASTPYKRWSKCTKKKIGGEGFCRNLAYLGGKCLNYSCTSPVTRCQILRLKYTKFDFGWGSAPDPAGGA